MQIEQRRPQPMQSFEPRPDTVWEVEVLKEDGSTWTVPASGNDFYVVVDDIDEGMITLDAARWPAVDERGRLAFTDLGEEHGARLSDVQEAVSTTREALGLPAPDRAIRVGDVFWVKGPDWPEGSLIKHKPVDVTAAARSAAKAAHFGAIAPTVTPDRAERMQLLPHGDDNSEAPDQQRRAAKSFRAMPEI